MKYLLAVCLLLTSCSLMADSGSSFATGFANALQRRLDNNENTQQVSERRYVWKAINDYGTQSAAEFINKTQCLDFVSTSGGYWVDCQLMEQNQ